jgi:hypothetical protein
MKFGFAKGLLGVLVLVACAEPSAVFGQYPPCNDVEVEADGMSKNGHPDARTDCHNNLLLQCLSPNVLQDEDFDFDRSPNGTYFTALCSALCICKDFDPVIPETKPAPVKPNTVPAAKE